MGVVITGLALGSVREAFDPGFTLYLDDLLGIAPSPVEMSLAEGVLLRAYTDTRPHTGKIDELQKGLVLVVDGAEKVEEGFGFGVPIVRYGDLTYLARHADVVQDQAGVDRQSLVKRFVVDVADHPSQPFRVKYRDVDPLGSVVVTYTVSTARVLSVAVDLTDLAPGWDEVFVMNEQGAQAFLRYQAESGKVWDRPPGIWEPNDDACGCWIDPEALVRFCVLTEPGRTRFIGRERYNQYHWAGIYYLAWSGIDLHLEPSDAVYRYDVSVQRLPSDWEDALAPPCP
jgi:hypothetical protein